MVADFDSTSSGEKVRFLLHLNLKIGINLDLGYALSCSLLSFSTLIFEFSPAKIE